MPASTLGPRLARWSSAGLAAGLLHGCVEGAVLEARDLGPLFELPDAVTVGVLAAAVLGLGAALLAALLALAAGALDRAPLRPALAAGLLALLAAAPALALNLPLMGRQPLAAGVLPLGALAVAAVAALAARLAPKRRWVRPALVIALLAAAAALFAGNALYLQGLYRPQHATLTYTSVALTTWALALALARAPARPLALVAALLAFALGLQAFVLLPPDLTQAQRGALQGRTVEATHALDLLGRAADLDGDGVPALLGGGDCAPLDADVHPGAVDVPDDPLDQDCLGGPATTAAIEALAASRALPLPPSTPAPAAGRPLILITVDTLRRDRALAMRSFERLAARGTRFERAFAPYPSTIFTVYGMLTGRAPSAVRTEHVVRWHIPRPDGSEGLAEVLARAGYRTAAVMFHHLFRPDYGLTRGFSDVWVDLAPGDRVVWGRSADETTDRAVAWLDRFAAEPERPYFLWVHYYDPHEPYVVHPETPPDDADDLAQLYDGEVRFTDLHLGRLLDRLEIGGELDRAVIVLTADHGESLGEHGRRFHASALTDEQIRVPLVLAGPGIPAAAQRLTPVSLLDLSPTLAELLGVPAPASQQGATFVGLLSGPDPAEAADRPVFAEVHDGERRQHGVVAWPWKLVHHLPDHRFELFDLARDAGERVDVYDHAPEQASHLRELLGTWVAGIRRPTSP